MKYIPGGNLISCGVRSQISSLDCPENRAAVKNALHVLYRAANNGDFKDVIGLQIIARSEGRKGFFLSHWYITSSFRQMLQDVFSVDSFSITESHFAKGMVFTIDPLWHKPQGVVTVLNNVIGNVLPHSQFETLTAIKGIIS